MYIDSSSDLFLFLIPSSSSSAPLRPERPADDVHDVVDADEGRVVPFLLEALTAHPFHLGQLQLALLVALR